ncbi:hypothetical protein LXL04_018256 [Taraxacum kok-saghyz]
MKKTSDDNREGPGLLNRIAQHLFNNNDYFIRAPPLPTHPTANHRSRTYPASTPVSQFTIVKTNVVPIVPNRPGERFDNHIQFHRLWFRKALITSFFKEIIDSRAAREIRHFRPFVSQPGHNLLRRGTL